MDQETIKLIEGIASLATTKIIATELDRVIEEIGNTEDSSELVACMVIAMLRSGKGTITQVS